MWCMYIQSIKTWSTSGGGHLQEMDNFSRRSTLGGSQLQEFVNYEGGQLQEVVNFRRLVAMKVVNFRGWSDSESDKLPEVVNYGGFAVNVLGMLKKKKR